MMNGRAADDEVPDDISSLAPVQEPGPGRSARILVIDDDPPALLVLEMALGEMGGYKVCALDNPRQALDLLAVEEWDLLITDLRLPEMSGLDVMRAARRRRPEIAVMVSSGHADVDTVIDALRLEADDFLVKPIVPAVLLSRVADVLTKREARSRREVALAIGAHPDDIEIGAGGTLLSHRDRGDAVGILIMSGGERGGRRGGRAAEAAAAAELLGAELFIERLEDTRIPESGQSVAIIEDVVAQLGATRIYTHSAEDRHQDHRNTHRAVMIAARSVPRIYCYQSPSCTIDYRPTRFEAIDSYLTGKIRLINCHGSQAASRTYLEEDLIVSTARYWGRFAGGRYAEPFEVARELQGGATSSRVEIPVARQQQMEASHGE